MFAATAKRNSSIKPDRGCRARRCARERRLPAPVRRRSRYNLPVERKHVRRVHSFVPTWLTSRPYQNLRTKENRELAHRANWEISTTLHVLARCFLVCRRMAADSFGSVTILDIVTAPIIADSATMARALARSGFVLPYCSATTSTSLRNPAVAAARVLSSLRASSLPSPASGQPSD
jgi:hypothetical protein